MNDLLMSRGTFTIGHTIRDKDGNILERVEPSFKSQEDGGSIVLVEVDDDCNQIGDASLFSSRSEDQDDIMDYICTKLNLEKRKCKFEKLNSPYPDYDHEFYCSKCHNVWGTNDEDDIEKVKYCPYCGCKIVKEYIYENQNTTNT